MGSQNLAIMKNLLVGTLLSTILSVALTQKTCLGRSSDWACCTDENPCDIGEGDCDRDSHCKPGLKCHNKADNCKDFNPMALSSTDCCFKPESPSECQEEPEVKGKCRARRTMWTWKQIYQQSPMYGNLWSIWLDSVYDSFDNILIYC